MSPTLSRLVLALSTMACGHAEIATRTASSPAIAPSTFGPSDLIEIRVFGEPDLSGVYQIGVDGSFDYPLIGTVKASGRTEREVGSEIAERLQQGYLKSPQVSILLKEQRSRKITVLGAVQKPGTFDYRDPMSILEAVSLAGGFTPLAAKNDTVVTRSGQRFSVSVEKIAEGRAPHFFLRPGDTILVPERIF